MPSAVSRTLDGFRSRWTIPPRCADSIASASIASQLGGLRGRPGRTGEHLGQAAPLDELHRKVRPAVEVADVVHLHDVRVPQPRDHLRFSRETLALAAGREGPGEQHLEGDGAVERPMHGLVDDPHSAAAQHLDDVIAGDLRQAGVERPGRENP